MLTKKVFLWYPRKIWKVKAGTVVQGFAWWTHATEYHQPKVTPTPDVEANKERWPTFEDFVTLQKPITDRPHWWYQIEIGRIRMFLPGLINMELLGIQAMTPPTGEIFVIKPYYGTNPAEVAE